MLYVDPDTERSAEFERRLEAAGGRYSITRADGPEAALAVLDADPIGCVVSVARFPDATGLALLEAVRETDPSLPFVLFVADGSESLASAAIDLDVTAYVRRTGDDPYDRLASRLDDAIATRRRRTDRALRARLTEGADAGLIAVGADGRIAVANEACASLLGTDPAALEGAPVDETALAAVEIDAVHGAPAADERTTTVRVERDGDARFVDVTAAPATVDGEAYALLTCADVTDRVEYERDSNVLDAIFDSIPVYLYVKDEAGRHVRVSDANEQAEAFLGKTDLEIWGEEARESYEDDMRVIEEGEEIVKKEEENLEHNQFYLTSKTPWRDENGEIRGLIGVTDDLSDWKRQERQLRRQNERLRTLASVISHDIRNPLQVARGRIEFVREEGDDEHVEATVDALDRMDELLGELLAMVRHGQWVEDPGWVDLTEIAADCWKTATGESATLDVAGGLVIRADPDRLRQLLENLFRNAVVHGRDDVHVTIGSNDERTSFYVADDGPGIPEGEREAVFEFGKTTSDDGTGFGLAIVEVIADAHGWDVRLGESEAGGARFEFVGVEFD